MSHLVVICPSYPDKNDKFIGGSFVKDQVEILKSQFDEISVLAPKMQSFGLIEKDRLCHDYSYDNVFVRYFGSFYVPPRLINYTIIDGRINQLISHVQNISPKPDMVYAHFTWPSGYIAAKLKQMLGIPYLLILHENNQRFMDAIKTRNRYFIDAWHHADRLLRVNPVDIKHLKIYNSDLHYFPNGIHPKFQYRTPEVARQYLDLPPEHPIIFSVGRMLPRKGFQDLIKAVVYIREDLPDNFHLFLGGSGPYIHQLERMVESLELSELITLIGYVSGDDIAYWMAAADLFVISSHNESFGIVALEALASGVPVISTRNNGSEYFVEENGIIVDAKAPIQMGDAILQGLSDDWDREEIAETYRQYIWPNLKFKLFEHIDAVIKSSTLIS